VKDTEDGDGRVRKTACKVLGVKYDVGRKREGLREKTRGVKVGQTRHV